MQLSWDVIVVVSSDSFLCKVLDDLIDWTTMISQEFIDPL